MSALRAADDFAAIRARLEELRGAPDDPLRRFAPGTPEWHARLRLQCLSDAIRLSMSAISKGDEP